MITQQEIAKAWDSLPEDLREHLSSDAANMALSRIFADNHIPEEKELPIMRVVGSSIAGIVSPEKLAAEISEGAHINIDASKAISNEIVQKILLPIAPRLQEVHGYSLSEPQQPATQSVAREVSATPETPAAPTQPTPPIQHSQEVNPPHAQPQQEPAIQVPPQTATPFVLHEHKEIESVSSGQEDHTLVRPTFYEEKESQAPQTSFTPTARLDIGSEEQQSAEGPPTIKVGSEHAKVVHYSRPTSNNPFDVKNQNTGPEIKKNPETRVDPSNVVNLKDLPK